MQKTLKWKQLLLNAKFSQLKIDCFIAFNRIHFVKTMLTSDGARGQGLKPHLLYIREAILEVTVIKTFQVDK